MEIGLMCIIFENCGCTWSKNICNRIVRIAIVFVHAISLSHLRLITRISFAFDISMAHHFYCFFVDFSLLFSINYYSSLFPRMCCSEIISMNFSLESNVLNDGDILQVLFRASSIWASLSEWLYLLSPVLNTPIRNLILASMRVSNRNFVLDVIIAIRGQIEFQCEHR